jgi:cysteinyl-tRNA synthetase
VLRALGLSLPETPDDAAVAIPAPIQALAEERWQFRLARDWAKSDELRAALAAKGWTVKDGKDGYTLTPQQACASS